MDPDKIPAELKALRQWVSFRIGPEKNGSGPRKVPLIPGTNRTASPTDPTTWRTFEEALAGGNPAFCLTKEDPYLFIDLDGKGKNPVKEELAEQILELFPGYQELSVSQTGMHIMLRGRLECERGLHRDGVEIYSHSRFCIVTGECLPGCTVIQEADPELLSELETQMQASGVHVPDMTEKPESGTDEEVLAKCRTSEKFCELWEGRWQQFGYPSPSEADHALIGIIANATPSNEQAHRLFERSELYRSDKPHKFKYSIRRVRARQEIDAVNDKFIDQLLGTTKKRVVEPENPGINDPRIYDMPGGLLKELYHTFQEWSYYPLREASLMAAFVTTLALFQRKYQTPTGLALNMMLFLTGPAGCGKETIHKGPRRLFKDAGAPMLGVFGGELRSLPAVEDALKGSIRHMAYHNECASWLRAMCDEHASPAWQQLRSKLTDVFTKGADVWSLRQTKVQKGDSKDYELDRPCLTVFGDCVTNDFYEAIGTRQISGGFIPRLTVLEVDADSISVDTGAQKPFDPDLLKRIKDYATDAMMADTAGGPVRAEFIRDAKAKFDEFSKEIRTGYKSRDPDKLSLKDDLKGRLAEKVIKIATLLGVCRSPSVPRVTLADIEWAIMFVKVTDGRMFHHLQGGEHDAAMHQQRKQIQRGLDTARLISPHERGKKRYFTSQKLCHEPNLVPWGWLRDYCGRVSCFKSDRRGIEIAMRTVLKGMEDSGEVILVDPAQAQEKFGTRSVVVVNCREERDDGDLF